MWSSWIVVAMVAISSYYALAQQNDTEQVSHSALQSTLAESMAVYRDSVVQYAHQHPAHIGAVPSVKLEFPEWHKNIRQDLWANYVDAKGSITIYAQKLPEIDINNEIVTLSEGAAGAGQFNAADNTIDAPNIVGARAKLPDLPPDVIIPDHAPVWLAFRY